MTNEIVLSDEERRHQAVEAAYDFVIPSYQMLISRFESADTRLTALLTLASSLTVGAPLLAKAANEHISFSSPFFRASVVLFLIGVVLGVIGRVRGSLTLPDPMVFHNTSLHEPVWKFKTNAVYFAGLAFDANTEAVRCKSTLAMSVTIALLLEILTLVAWFVFPFAP